MTVQRPRPPFDPELEATLVALLELTPSPITPDHIEPMRRSIPGMPTPEQVLGDAGLERRDVTIVGHGGDAIELSIVQRPGRAVGGPGIFHTHGGGMIIGDRWTGLSALVPWILEHDAVVVTVEYRLAPEFPDPYPVEDCYAGLVWTDEHLDELGIDPSRLIIAGASAGGGLAAGTALLARDRGGPAIAGQVLMCPMLDDRDASVSTMQFDGTGAWDRMSNLTGWNALLGERRGTDDVSIYAAPARATDLSGLPPAFIDCGSAEVFRDEDVAYATALWHAGISAELHVWPGGFHAFEMMAPHAALSKTTVAARDAWVRRILAIPAAV